MKSFLLSKIVINFISFLVDGGGVGGFGGVARVTAVSYASLIK
jgi:hypothetical protein